MLHTILMHILRTVACLQLLGHRIHCGAPDDAGYPARNPCPLSPARPNVEDGWDNGFLPRSS